MADENCTRSMNRLWVIIFTLYLIVTTFVNGYFVYSLWSLEPKVLPTDLGAQTADDRCKNGSANTKEPIKAALTQILPDAVAINSPSEIRIIGCGFSSATQVMFNGSKHSSLFVSSGLIRLPLQSADVSSVGTYDIELSDGKESVVYGTGLLKVGVPLAEWVWFGHSIGPLSQETLLLLLVIFMGAFGSSVYALKSLGDYQGEGTLYASWSTYYFIQPLEGAGIAVLLYLVIRGGFLAGTGADVKAVNQFGICAIAGLAGAFSDTAFMKLREVFITLFKPQDNRSSKIDQLAVSTTCLKDGVVNQAYDPVQLTAQNGAAPLNWAVAPNLPADLKLDSATGTIAGTPSAVLAKTSYTFTVTDSSTPPATATKVLTLTISEPQV